MSSLLRFIKRNWRSLWELKNSWCKEQLTSVKYKSLSKDCSQKADIKSRNEIELSPSLALEQHCFLWMDEVIRFTCYFQSNFLSCMWRENGLEWTFSRVKSFQLNFLRLDKFADLYRRDLKQWMRKEDAIAGRIRTDRMQRLQRSSLLSGRHASQGSSRTKRCRLVTPYSSSGDWRLPSVFSWIYNAIAIRIGWKTSELLKTCHCRIEFTAPNVLLYLHFSTQTISWGNESRDLQSTLIQWPLNQHFDGCIF